MGKENIHTLFKKLRNAKNVDNYNTGLVGEKLIVSSYETMSIQKLVALRFILNGIIKKKKDHKRGFTKKDDK